MTRTVSPARASRRAAVSPPIPAPMTIALRAAMVQPQEHLQTAPGAAHQSGGGVNWWKRLLIHLGHEQEAAAAAELVNRIGKKTQQCGELGVVRTAPAAHRRVGADHLSPSARVA